MRAKVRKFAVPLAAVLASTLVLILESTLNRPSKELDHLIVSDIHNQQLSLTIPVGNGTYGFEGYGPGTYGSAYTCLVWSGVRVDIPLSIYTALVWLLAALVLVAWGGRAIMRRAGANGS